MDVYISLSNLSQHITMALLTINREFGEVSEWLKEPVSKTGVPLGVPRVRIPPSPVDFFSGGLRCGMILFDAETW